MNKEGTAAYKAKWQRENKERMKQVRLEYRLRNKSKVYTQVQTWREKNPEIGSFASAKTRTKNLNAIPAWVDFKSVKEIYKEATRLREETGESHVVDHIIPLESTEVCGLHWEGNLQILTHSENLLKGKKIEQR